MNNKQIIIFLGAPGSGKGALSRLCTDGFGWKQLSTGNLCRIHRAEGTALGKQIDFALKSGTLVSDEVIIDIAIQWIDQELKNAPAIILDGFPRTVVQAAGFLQFLDAHYSRDIVAIIELNVPDEEIIKRLSSRLVCSNKLCQAVFSNRTDALRPQNTEKCDFCGALLVQREDDKPEVIAGRLATYHQHRNSLVDFYKNAGYVVHTIDGNRQNKEVFDSFLQCVSNA